MRIGISRIGIGLLQGIALAALWPAYQALGGARAPSITWEAFHVIGPLVFALLFTPVAINLALGRLRWPLLAAWAGVVAFISVGAGLNIAYGEKEHLALELLLTWPALLVVVLIGQSLMVAWDAKRTQGDAFYPACFEAAWRHVLALMFSAVLIWLVGDALIESVGSHPISIFPSKYYLQIPMITTMSAAAQHIVDTHEKLMHKVRNLLLEALAWVLPALVATLAFAWAGERLLTPVLLLQAVLLIVLINVIYRDGGRNDRILRTFGVAAVLSLPLLTLAAGFALPLLRLGHPSLQQPWMIEHVYSAATVGIVAVYAVGYLFAVRWFTLRTKVLERVNIGGAFATMTVLLALNTPMFDPARISAGLQMARFHLGRVQPDQSDGWYRYMGRGLGRYGRDELQLLARHSSGPDAGETAQRAQWALTDATRDRLARNAAGVLLPPERRAHNITVVSADGATLPNDFLQLRTEGQPNMSARSVLRDCFTTELDACLVVILNREQYGRQGIVLISRRLAILFTQDDTETWLGHEQTEGKRCLSVRTMLASGQNQTTLLLFPTVMAAGVRLRLWSDGDCQ